MLSANLYSGKKVGVLGLGRTGTAIIPALIRGGAEVVAWDDRENARDNYLDLVTGKHDILLWDKNHGSAKRYYDPSLVKICKSIEQWNDIDVLIMSPGTPSTGDKAHKAAIYARKIGASIKSDIEVLWEHKRDECRFVGITGTNGKTTTTTMIYEVLKDAGYEVDIGGNIGIPVFDMMDLNTGGIYVIEISSYQLELSPKMNFDVGILTNIDIDHLDRHGTMEKYKEIKSCIFSENGSNIIGIDSYETKKLIKDSKKKDFIMVSSLKDIEGGISCIKKKICDVDNNKFVVDTCLSGDHNMGNIALCYAACKSLGLQNDKILNGISKFKGVPHRQEFIRELDGVIFINDSKATNVLSSHKALEVYDKIYWIVGGQKKCTAEGEDNFSSFVKYKDKIVKIYCIGLHGIDIAQALTMIDYQECKELKIAIQQSYLQARENGGGVVLLSPACASFDQYNDFEERGEEFRKIVSTL